ncbi:MAG: hypothetical protein QOE62_1711 [Actinomycetota bacterium]|nr:hypothetical protein [Actinomycetota bacterium]
MLGRTSQARRVLSGARAAKLVLAAAVACAALIGGATAASAAPAWSLVKSPNPPSPPKAILGAIACPSPTTCLTVGPGRPGFGGPARALYAERWDGSARRRVPIQIPSGFSVGSVDGLSCSDASSCFAVGAQGSGPDSPLVERWNGSTWALVSVPVPASASRAWLTGVSCPSPSLCLATGSDATPASEPSVAGSFVDRWNGASWTLTSVATPAGATKVELRKITCVTATSCFAVGSYATTSIPAHTLVEHWNGTAWSVMATPNPAGSAGQDAIALVDVSCASATNCVAIGTYTPTGPRPFSERWNGTSWSLIATASPPIPQNSDGAGLQSVSCTSTTECIAVGKYSSNTSVSLPWIQRFDGTAWTSVASPDVGIPPSAAGGSFGAVSCSGPGACLAVGAFQVVGDPDPLALVERWSGGSWSILPAPDGSSQSELRSTDCPSPTLCFAVGSSIDQRGTTLIGRWDGTSWSVLTSPNPVGATKSQLTQIACASVTSCFAVGDSIFDGNDVALVERWDGAHWSIVTIPNPRGATGAGISDVSCPTSTRCIAVGWSSQGELVAQWDGAHWSVTNSDVSGGGSIESLSCPTTTTCFAVGSSGFSTLVRRWNGRNWSTVASPNGPAAIFSDLSDVSCSASNACVAVGSWASASSSGNLVERWNGSTWTRMTTPAPSFVQINLLSVSCPTDIDCVAVGSYSSGGTVVERWNGSTWRLVASPDRTNTLSTLLGVSCATAANCLAVGNAETNLYRFSLVERFG